MKIGPTQAAAPVARKRQPSKYREVAARALGLKAGQQFEVAPESAKTDADVQNFRNRLSSALRHAIGNKFQIRLIRTEADKICVQRRDAKDDIYLARSKATKSKAKAKKPPAKKARPKTVKKAPVKKAAKPRAKKVVAKKGRARKGKLSA